MKQILTANLSSTLVISIVLSSFVVFLTILSPNIFSSAQLATILPIHLAALPLFNLNKNFRSYYCARRNQKKIAIIKTMRWTGLAALLYFFSVSNFELAEMMLAFIIVEGAIVIYNVLSNLNSFNFSFKKKLVRETFAFGLGSYVSEITSIVNSSMDIIIVGYLLSSADAGRYSFIIFFVKTLYIFPGILMQNINPIISHHWAQNQISELNVKLKKLRIVNILVLTIQATALLLVYNFLMTFLKHTNNASFEAFSISLIGSYVFALISWGGSILIMTGKLKANFQRTSLVLILNLVSIIVLTFYFGFIGSVLAVSLNGITSFMLLRTFIHRKTGLKLI
ncbi:MAG: oligosaccharide flippase family protein [Crocinitomicaceae bacterium]|nr:oligosaccharide flippase family protein [Crocinitomicaceae bacterium]